MGLALMGINTIDKKTDCDYNNYIEFMRTERELWIEKCLKLPFG